MKKQACVFFFIITSYVSDIFNRKKERRDVLAHNLLIKSDLYNLFG